jgi:hypothetical protein
VKKLIRTGAACALAGFAMFAVAEEKAAAPAATPVAAGPMVIYDTALASGWQNWSWAKTELSVQIEGSARKPIKVEAAGWQALYLQHEAFNTAGYQNVEFLIQGSVPEAEVRVIALINGKPANDGRTVKIDNKGWKRVVTPLRTLGAEETSIDGLWVQNASANDLPKFYVTEIKLQ